MGPKIYDIVDDFDTVIVLTEPLKDFAVWPAADKSNPGTPCSADGLRNLHAMFEKCSAWDGEEPVHSPSLVYVGALRK